MNSPTEFTRLAAGVVVSFTAERPVWYWPVRSLASEVQGRRLEVVLTWLAD